MFDLAPLHLPPEAVILDGGANEGQFIDHCYANLKCPRIVAVEMLPDLARLIAERHPNATVLNCALADKTYGRVAYHRTAQSQMSSLLPPSALQAQYYGPEDCREIEQASALAWALGDLLEALLLDSVDLLKLDLQGAELEALRGAGPLLHRVRHIVAECELVECYQNQPLAAAVIEYLAQHGFTCRGSLEDHRRGDVLIAQDLWFTPASDVSNVVQAEE